MEDMDGIELIRKINKIFPKIPIICMSGNPIGSKFLPSSLVFGVKATLSKPFSRDELISAITFATTNSK